MNYRTQVTHCSVCLRGEVKTGCVRGEGSVMMLPARFFTLELYKSWRLGRWTDTNDHFCCPNSPLQSSYFWFAGLPKPDRYRGAQNRLNNSRVKLSYAPVAGLTFSVDERRTTSAEPFSRWSQCDCPTSGPERWWFPGTWMTPLQSQCCSW